MSKLESLKKEPLNYPDTGGRCGGTQLETGASKTKCNSTWVRLLSLKQARNFIGSLNRKNISTTLTITVMMITNQLLRVIFLQRILFLSSIRPTSFVNSICLFEQLVDYHQEV